MCSYILFTSESTNLDFIVNQYNLITQTFKKFMTCTIVLVIVILLWIGLSPDFVYLWHHVALDFFSFMHIFSILIWMELLEIELRSEYMEKTKLIFWRPTIPLHNDSAEQHKLMWYIRSDSAKTLPLFGKAFSL